MFEAAWIVGVDHGHAAGTQVIDQAALRPVVVGTSVRVIVEVVAAQIRNASVGELDAGNASLRQSRGWKLPSPRANSRARPSVRASAPVPERAE